MFLRTSLSLVMFLTIACNPVQTTVTRLDDSVYPPKPKDCKIEVLTQVPTDRKFKELAILNTVTTGKTKPPLVSFFDTKTGKDLNEMLPNIKATACSLGADAILIKNVDPGGPNAESAGKAYTVAIKFID